MFCCTSRQPMGRNRKWVLEDSIQDAVWKTILRGPRPPSVRWEKQRSQSAGANSTKKDVKAEDSAHTRQPKAEPKVVEPKVVPTRNRLVRQSPPEMYAAVHAKILRLQAAISALGDADVVEIENLARALQRAQAQAVVPPVSEQIISTQGFIERERKRLATAEEALIVAVKNRDESLAALAQGEKRLEELQSQEKSPFAGPVVDAETELVRLRAQVAELQGRAEVSITSVIPADAMPRVPAELSVWMADRQTDLQEALSTEDHSRVVKLSLMLAKGAERMVEMSLQDISDDEFRSRGAPGEGRFAPY